MDNIDITESDNYIFKIAYIIAGNEGRFNSINQYDGPASSIGILQWNGPRAKKLLRLIISKNEEHAKVVLTGTNIIDSVKKDTEFWNNKILDFFECEKIRDLLGTEYGVKAQIELLKIDIKAYISHGKKLGITNDKALAYFADLENQVGYFTAEKIVQSIDSSKELTLFNILNASTLHPSLFFHTKRRAYTYTKIMNTNFLD